MPLTLTGRLLCAARLAYTITQNDEVPATLADAKAAGLGNADGFACGTDLIDACLVGEGDDGIIVAFRGTLPIDGLDPQKIIEDWAYNLGAAPAPQAEQGGELQIIDDWVNDANALLVPQDEFGGAVHKGFLGALDALWPDVKTAIKRRLANNPAKPIQIVGHSKGGALANLAAIRCLAEFPGKGVIVTTFAAARAGNDDFAAFYATKISNSTRYEYTDDIVPHLPPSDAFADLLKTVPGMENVLPSLHLGYVSVGKLQFIDWTGQIIGDGELLRLKRLESLTMLMLKLCFEVIVKDHSISDGSGYATALCVV